MKKSNSLVLLSKVGIVLYRSPGEADFSCATGAKSTTLIRKFEFRAPLTTAQNKIM